MIYLQGFLRDRQDKSVSQFYVNYLPDCNNRINPPPPFSVICKFKFLFFNLFLHCTYEFFLEFNSY
jgi:hypothetical protein